MLTYEFVYRCAIRGPQRFFFYKIGGLQNLNGLEPLL